MGKVVWAAGVTSAKEGTTLTEWSVKKVLKQKITKISRENHNSMSQNLFERPVSKLGRVQNGLRHGALLFGYDCAGNTIM